MMKKMKRWNNRRKGAKRVDIKKSLEQQKKEFFVYWPDPSLDLDEYKDEDDNVDVDLVPDDMLYEFCCRYITPQEFNDITDPRKPLEFDRNALKNKDLTEEQLKDMFLDAIEKGTAHVPSDAEVTTGVVFMSCVEPKFESVDQVAQILPVGLQNAICDEAITFLDRGVLVQAMDEKLDSEN